MVQVLEKEGGSDDPRLIPLLAGIGELVPWLKQWHNEPDPEFGIGMGNYFAGFVQEQALRLGKTVPELKEWVPPANSRGRRAAVARVAEPRARRERAPAADREAMKEKILDVARQSAKVTNAMCLEVLGEGASAAMVSQLLKALSAEGGPLEKVGSKGPGVFYRLRG